jgi:hypothetical protein
MLAALEERAGVAAEVAPEDVAPAPVPMPVAG